MQKETLDEAISLKSIPLFSELSTDQLRLITSISRVAKYKKHSIIFLAGELNRGFYIVLKGSVKVFRVSPSAKETIIHIIKPFNVFADAALFESEIYPVSSQTLEDSMLLFIPKNEFISLLEKNANICLKMLSGFAKRMRYLTQRIDEISNKEVTGRLAEYIIGEIEKEGKLKLTEPVIRLDLPKSTIASLLGTITETLSRSFRRLQDEAIIRVDGKKIFILDICRLKGLAAKQ